MSTRIKLTKSVVERLDREKDGQWVTDTEVPELVVRLTPTSKTYVARWTSRRNSKRSQVRIEKVGYISVAEARDRARKIVSDDNHTTADTLGDLFKVWDESYSSTISEGHAEEFRRSWEKHIGPDLGKTKLARLNHATLQDWYNKKCREHPVTAKGKKADEPFSPSTVNRWIGYISKLCAIARKRGEMTANPCEGLEKKANIVRLDVFTKDDLKIIADNMEAVEEDFPIGVALLRFMMIFPCRGAEARDMQWTDLDLDEATWTIPAARYKTRQNKVFPLGPMQVDFLRNLPRWHDKFVFPRPSHVGVGNTKIEEFHEVQPVTKNHQIAVWKKVRNKPLGAHTFRKTLGTMYLNSGIPLEAVSQILGHSNTQTTQRAYAHLQPATASKYLANFNGLTADDEVRVREGESEEESDEMIKTLRFQASRGMNQQRGG